MIAKRDAAKRELSRPWYTGADIPMSVIRRYAKQLGAAFQPEKIVLFGSYAYGKPNEHSDVDLLVVMGCNPRSARQSLGFCGFLPGGLGRGPDWYLKNGVHPT